MRATTLKRGVGPDRAGAAASATAPLAGASFVAGPDMMMPMPLLSPARARSGCVCYACVLCVCASSVDTGCGW